MELFTFFTISHVAQVNSAELSGCLHHILQFFAIDVVIVDYA